MKTIGETAFALCSLLGGTLTIPQSVDVDVEFSSDDENVVYIDDGGYVQFIGGGNTLIHAKIKKNFEICKKKCNFAPFLILIHMKKVILLAMMAVGMSVMAQQVNPLQITVAEVKLDSLRSLYGADPIMYRASLESLAQALSKNADEIKAAKAELKVEQAHAKEMANSLKEAGKMTASLKKLYDKEESELKSMQKVVEKQQKTISKQKELKAETRENYVKFLEKQQKELGYSLREVADRQRAITDLETSIQNHQTTLQSFILEVGQKATDLANIEAQHKERTAAVKAEQKAYKDVK